MDVVIDGALRKNAISEREAHLYRVCASYLEKYRHETGLRKKMIDTHMLSAMFVFGYRLASTSEMDNVRMTSLVIEMLDRTLDMEDDAKWIRWCRNLSEVWDLPPGFLLGLADDMALYKRMVTIPGGFIMLERLRDDQDRGLTIDNLEPEMRKFVDSTVEKLERTPLFKRLMDMDADSLDALLDKPTLTKANHYNVKNSGKTYLSIDVVKGAASAFLYILPHLLFSGEVDGFGELEPVLCDPETGMHRWSNLVENATPYFLIKESKKIRQKVFGMLVNRTNLHEVNLVDIINRAIQYIIQKTIGMLPSIEAIPRVRVSNILDEVIFELPNDIDTETVGLNFPKTISWWKSLVRVEVFTLLYHTLPSGKGFFVKQHRGSKKPAEIKGLDLSLHDAARATYTKSLFDSR